MKLTRSNIPIFYKIKIDDNIWRNFRGLLSNENDLYLFEHISLNRFKDEPTIIPDNCIKIETPSEEWMNNYFINENKTLAICPESTPVDITLFNWYEIMDNGGISYVVYVHKVGNEVYVYKIPDNVYIEQNNINIENYIKYYTECLFHFKSPIKVWLGKHTDMSFEGNTVLIQVTSKTYIYIGSEINIFVSNECITNYYSYVGNNSVPYPVALSENYIFFMLDKTIVLKSEFIEKSFGDNYTHTQINFDNAYNYYYKHKFKNLDKFNTLENCIKIANRNAVVSKYVKSFKERFYNPDKGNYINIGSKQFKLKSIKC